MNERVARPIASRNGRRQRIAGYWHTSHHNRPEHVRKNSPATALFNIPDKPSSIVNTAINGELGHGQIESEKGTKKAAGSRSHRAEPPDRRCCAAVQAGQGRRGHNSRGIRHRELQSAYRPSTSSVCSPFAVTIWPGGFQTRSGAVGLDLSPLPSAGLFFMPPSMQLPRPFVLCSVVHTSFNTETSQP